LAVKSEKVYENYSGLVGYSGRKLPRYLYVEDFLCRMWIEFPRICPRGTRLRLSR
jgi:hypothetical protein